MLDTHTLVKRLTQAGVPEAQAEAHMAVFLDISEHGFATRSDIDRLDRHMDGLATKEILSEVKRDVETLKTDLTCVKEDLVGVKTDLAGVKTDLAGVKTDLAGVKTDLACVKEDLVGVKTDLAGVKEDLVGVKTDLAGVKTGVASLKETFACFERDFESRMVGMTVTMTGMELRLLVRLGGLIVALMSAGFGILEFTLAH